MSGALAMELRHEPFLAEGLGDCHRTLHRLDEDRRLSTRDRSEIELHGHKAAADQPAPGATQNLGDLLYGFRQNIWRGHIDLRTWLFMVW